MLCLELLDKIISVFWYLKYSIFNLKLLDYAPPERHGPLGLATPSPTRGNATSTFKSCENTDWAPS